jgi:hypothetical protein
LIGLADYPTDSLKGLPKTLGSLGDLVEPLPYLLLTYQLDLYLTWFSAMLTLLERLLSLSSDHVLCGGV